MLATPGNATVTVCSCLLKTVMQSIVQELNVIALTIKEIFVPPTVFLYASGTL